MKEDVNENIYSERKKRERGGGVRRTEKKYRVRQKRRERGIYKRRERREGREKEEQSGRE